jgi:hypothetical protein
MYVPVNSRFTEDLSTWSWLTSSFRDGGVTNFSWDYNFISLTRSSGSLQKRRSSNGKTLSLWPWGHGLVIGCWWIVILYTYISMTHYKSLISILSTCKYHTSSYAMSSFSLKNISKNSRSISHRLMPHHLSPFKNNSKNSRNSSYATSPFSIKK